MGSNLQDLEDLTHLRNNALHDRAEGISRFFKPNMELLREAGEESTKQAWFKTAQIIFTILLRHWRTHLTNYLC